MSNVSFYRKEIRRLIRVIIVGDPFPYQFYMPNRFGLRRPGARWAKLAGEKVTEARQLGERGPRTARPKAVSCDSSLVKNCPKRKPRGFK